jgi:CRISPR-associated protein Cas1
MTGIGRRTSTPKELVRAADRISFVYLDRCVINRDSNAITATDERGTVHLPAAAVGVLLLGPGTTITHQAIALMADSGSTVVWVGERGVRYYAHGTAASRTSRLVQAQAEAVTNALPAAGSPRDVRDAVSRRGRVRADHAAATRP